ncbi:MAG TPA: T9SS type A sorting domain-containing protein [Bacteroidia bacterium]|nr:T9SS type A sorting domain-containing protein [Bacteroidia bacterium]
MKKITLLFIGIIFSVNGICQITFERTFSYSPSNYDSRSFTCQQTSDGNYVIGSYQPVPPQANNIHLIKLDVNGDTIWTRIYDWTYTVCRAIQQTADSGFILTGPTSNPGSGGTYLLKTNSIGNVQWVKTYIMATDSYDAYSVRQTNDGGYILTGNTDWTTQADMFLLKTDSAGNAQWSKTYGGAFDDWGNCVRQTFDGGYVMTGALGYDVVIIKVDNSGNVQWTKTFDLGGDERGKGIQQTPDSGYIVTGTNDGTYLIKTDVNGNLVWSKTYTPGAGYCVDRTTDGGYVIVNRSPEASLIKVNATGNFSWAKGYVGNVYSESFSGEQTNDGGYFLSGETQNATNVTVVYAIKTDSLGNSGCNNILSLTEITPATVVTSPSITGVAVTPIVTVRSVSIIQGVTPEFLCVENIGELSSEENSISLSPNPATNEITVQSLKFKVQSVEIYNTLGENVYSNAETSETSTETINVRKLSSGIYFVRVKTKEGEKAVKFVKE